MADDPDDRFDEEPPVWFAEFRTALLFLTRLPAGLGRAGARESLADSSRYFPVVGVLVGLVGAIVLWVAAAAGLSPWLSAVLALFACVWITGALHEDGLADTADGFGAGESRERRLEIMHDSRTGTYGIIAIVFSLGARGAALAYLAGVDAWEAGLALIGAEGASRATLVPLMHYVSPAREDGLSADAGRPGTDRMVTAAAIGIVVLMLCFGFTGGIVAAAIAGLAAGLVGALSNNQIGGQTGDSLGAAQQISAIAVLVTASAFFPS